MGEGPGGPLGLIEPAVRDSVIQLYGQDGTLYELAGGGALCLFSADRELHKFVSAWNSYVVRLCDVEGILLPPCGLHKS